MNMIFGCGFRFSVLAVALALAACGTSGKQQAAGTVDNTIVATVPEPAVQDNAATPAPTTDSGQPITLDKTVWSNYQAYLQKVGGIGDGYFFVTQDGQGAGSWACGNALCEGSFDGQDAAKQQCEASSPGKTCVLFAKDSRIQVNYTVVP
jgi:hypothetical protein